MSNHLEVNKNILDKINEQDCCNAIKEFLRKVFIYELGRRKGEEFTQMYKREVDRGIVGFSED